MKTLTKAFAIFLLIVILAGGGCVARDLSRKPRAFADELLVTESNNAAVKASGMLVVERSHKYKNEIVVLNQSIYGLDQAEIRYEKVKGVRTQFLIQQVHRYDTDSSARRAYNWFLSKSIYATSLTNSDWSTLAPNADAIYGYTLGNSKGYEVYLLYGEFATSFFANGTNSYLDFKQMIRDFDAQFVKVVKSKSE